MATAATRDYQIDREAVTIGLHRVSQKLVLCIHHCEELVNRAPRAVLRANLVHKHRSHSEIKDTAGMRPFGVVPAGGRMPIARRSLVLERDTLQHLLLPGYRPFEDGIENPELNRSSR